jgi:hypothetical protein
LSEISNATGQTIVFSIERDGVLPRRYTLAVGQSTQLAALDGTKLVIVGRRETLTLRVHPGRKYSLQRTAAGGVDLAVVGMMRSLRPARRSNPPPPDAGIHGAKTKPTGPQPGGAKKEAQPAAPVRIALKVLVDEEERAATNVWKQRLADRVQSASDIVEKNCGIQFYVAQYDTWNSDDRVTDFGKSLREFEQEVPVGNKARIAVGFTSQYDLQRGRVHLGGTRGALHTHILVREWSRQISEPERLELLLHELGHFLGASHSSDSTSVMRPVLGDRQSRARAFEIQFDATNVRILRLMSAEMRQRPVTRLVELTPNTKEAMRREYGRMVTALPKDPAAARFLYLLDHARPPQK